MTESVIDKRIDQAVEFYGDSDTCLKLASIAAARVVGTYSGATQEIAKRAKRSVATVENWAHAFRLYEELRGNPDDRKRVRSLWRELPASHWWQAYDIQRAGYDALYYLDNAEKHDWSGRGMMGEYQKEREAGHAPLIFRHACHTFYSLANELLKQIEKLTDRQLSAIEAVQDAFEV